MNSGSAASHTSSPSADRKSRLSDSSRHSHDSLDLRRDRVEEAIEQVRATSRRMLLMERRRGGGAGMELQGSRMTHGYGVKSPAEVRRSSVSIGGVCLVKYDLREASPDA